MSEMNQILYDQMFGFINSKASLSKRFVRFVEKTTDVIKIRKTSAYNIFRKQINTMITKDMWIGTTKTKYISQLWAESDKEKYIQLAREKDIEKNINHKPESDIKRINCYIAYCKDKVNREKYKTKKLLCEQWKQEPPDVKEKYKRKALEYNLYYKNMLSNEKSENIMTNDNLIDEKDDISIDGKDDNNLIDKGET